MPKFSFSNSNQFLEINSLWLEGDDPSTNKPLLRAPIQANQVTISDHNAKKHSHLLDLKSTVKSSVESNSDYFILSSVSRRLFTTWAA
ncbi:hypothetical protein ACFX11_035083 [Malus domestica]